MTTIISEEEPALSRDIAAKLSQNHEIKFRDCSLIRKVAYLTGKSINFDIYYKVLHVIPYASTAPGAPENLTMIKIEGIENSLSNLWFSKYR